MLSNKPYLIRAFYQWIIDSSCTPYIVINANFPRCQVPGEHVENGEITLNISPMAVRHLNITNDLFEFRASFSGVVHLISAPIKAVLAIYANENQQGMFFDYEDIVEEEEDGSEGAKTHSEVPVKKQGESKVGEKNRSHLKLVE